MTRLWWLNVIFMGLAGLTLSACSSFDKDFKPDDVAWTYVKGDKTLTVRGYTLYKNDKTEYYCPRRAGEAALIPDTPYFRDWVRILHSPWSWKSSPSNKAKKTIRLSAWRENCIYTFNHVPPGKWLIMINMKPYLKSSYSQAGNFAFNNTYQVADMTYVPLVIKPEDTIVKKNIIMDFARRKDIGWFKVHRILTPGEIQEWTDPPQ